MAVIYGPSAVSTELAPSVQKVLAYVNANPGSTADSIATALGIPIQQVYWAVMITDGYELVPVVDSEALPGKPPRR